MPCWVGRVTRGRQGPVLTVFTLCCISNRHSVGSPAWAAAAAPFATLPGVNYTGPPSCFAACFWVTSEGSCGTCSTHHNIGVGFCTHPYPQPLGCVEGALYILQQ